MYRTLKEKREANLKKLQERTQKIILRREIKKVVKEQIIFERKQQQLNEGLGDILGTLGHIGAAAWGAFLPGEATGTSEAADAINAVAYLLEGDYLMSLLSFISVVPGIGDLVGKPIMALRGLSTMLGNEGRIAGAATQIAEFLTRNSDTIKRGAQSALDFVKTNKRNIKNAIQLQEWPLGSHPAVTMKNLIAIQQILIKDSLEPQVQMIHLLVRWLKYY